MKPMFYLAGPISRPDPMVNAANAIRIAEQLMAEYPIVLFTPQLSVLHQLVAPRTHEAWLDYDFDIIVNCEGLIRIPGDSVGADMEEIFAETVGLRIYHLDKASQFTPEVEARFRTQLRLYEGANTWIHAAKADAQEWGDKRQRPQIGAT